MIPVPSAAEAADLPKCPNVLLSIEPEHADAILSGEKGWEYRRVAPTRGPPLRLVLYATAPVQAAVGVAWSWTVLERPVAALVGETVRFTPHDQDEVLDYFDGTETGYAIRIGCYRRFGDPLSRRQLEAAGMAPSQNFRYLKDVTADPEYVDEGERLSVVPGGGA